MPLSFKRCLTNAELMTEDPWSMYEQKLLSPKHSLNMVYRVLDIAHHTSIHNQQQKRPLANHHFKADKPYQFSYVLCHL